MSKASAWARMGRRVMRFRERLTPYQRRRKMTPLIAAIHDQGDLMIGEDQRLRPKEALRLAHWILDTFDDKETAQR